jgi:hypothetical protein
MLPALLTGYAWCLHVHTRGARLISHPLNSGMSDLDIAPVRHAAVTFFNEHGAATAVLRFSDGLEILVGERCVARWPYAGIHRLDGSQDVLRLECLSASPASRLEIRDDILKHEILALAHLKDLPPAPLHRDRATVIAWSLAAVAIAAALAFFGIPYAARAVAPLVPQSLERRLGDLADLQISSAFNGKTCTGREGTAAFAKLVGAVKTASGLEGDVLTQVLDVAVPNAFALPGGRIYLFRGLWCARRIPTSSLA